MFRDRSVFKALLDDFTACLLHGSHGTLGSIKNRQTTDTSMYFPLLNPLILVQPRMLREIQPSSIPTRVSPPSSALAPLWGRQVCPHTSPALPKPRAATPGRDLPPGTTKPQGCAGTCPSRSLHPPPVCPENKAECRLEPPGFGQTLCKRRALHRAAGSSSAARPCRGSCLRWDHRYHRPGGAQRPGAAGARGASSPRRAPSPGTATFGARDSTVTGGCRARVGRDNASTEDP